MKALLRAFLRSVSVQKRQADAMERIATSLEELLLRQGGSSGIRTYYRDKGGEDGSALLNQTDEDFALLEALEKQRTDKGIDVPLDEDLDTREWRR